MELLSVKILVLALSGFVRLLFGLTPLLVMRCLSQKFRQGKFPTIVSFLMFFGGGVLLATCFLHMMPEVREAFKTALPQSEFPVAEVIFIGGFFVVYILEDMVHNIVDHRRSQKRKLKEEALDGGRFEANINGAYQSAGDISYVGSKMSSPIDSLASQNPAVHHQQQLHQHQNHVHVQGSESRRKVSQDNPPVGGVHVLPRIRALENNNKIVVGPPNHHQPGGDERTSYVDPDWWRDTVIANSQLNLLSNSSLNGSPAGIVHQQKNFLNKTQHANNYNHQHNAAHPYNNNDAPNDTTSTTSGSSNSTAPVVHDSHHHDHDDHDHKHSHIPIGDGDEDSVAGSIRNLLIVVAISFHGIFEGLAIGLQGTERNVWYLFLAVSLHECTILFCIGVELISSKTKVLRMLTYITVVSMVSPVGIAIGIYISEKTFVSDVVHALTIGSLQGLAAGTLLYVTFFEIFASEGRHLKIKSLHILVAVMGFILMASLELLGGHSHAGHGGAEGHSHGGHSTSSHNHTDDHDDDHQHHHGEEHHHDHADHVH